MSLRLVISQSVVKARLGGMTVQLLRSMPKLEHRDYAMQQSWEIGILHCTMLRGKVSARGLELCIA